MKTMIFQTENAVFKFNKKKVNERLIRNQSEYDPNEDTQLLKLISTDSDKIYLCSDDHSYFGYVVLDLISEGIGTVTCNICEKIYDAGQLKEFAVGYGKSPFDINQQQKGGFSSFGKRRMPSLFGCKRYNCPAGHKLISMEAWKT